MSKRVQKYPHGIFVLKGHIDLTNRASELIHKVTQFSLILAFLRTHQLDRLMSTDCLKRLFIMILDLIQSSLFQKKLLSAQLSLHPHQKITFCKKILIVF